MQDNQTYYDEFAKIYEKERHDGYHALLDELEVELVKKYATSQMSLLEVGCGTGLILKKLASCVKEAKGVDLSKGMLELAKQKGLDVTQGSATQLPFADESFDLVCSFKVLAHVEKIEQALFEMNRVLKPGGILIAEFYNPWSLRYLVKKIKKPTYIGEKTTDEAILTRYDTLGQIRNYLPSSLQMIHLRGIRIFTPISKVHKIPGVRLLFRFLEKSFADVPGVRRLAGFLAVVARKEQG